MRSLQMIRTARTVGILQKLSTINDVTKYRGIPVSRYLLTGNYSHPIGECTPKVSVHPQNQTPLEVSNHKLPTGHYHIGYSEQ